MKTTITTLLVALAVSANAASLSWGSGTSGIKFDGSSITDASVFLVYLGSSSDLTQLYDFVNGEIVGADSVQEANITTRPVTMSGRFAATYRDPTATRTDVGTQVADGQWFGVYVTYTDATGTQWFNISSTAFQISGIGDDTTNSASATFAFDWTGKNDSVTSASDIAVGGGWYAAATAPVVPEPSVALMGLLGLGMMLKRRRA